VLQEHGINASDTKRLREAGFCTVESVQQATRKELLEVKGITEARVESLFDAAGKISDKHTGKFRTGTELKVRLLVAWALTHSGPAERFCKPIPRVHGLQGV